MISIPTKQLIEDLEAQMNLRENHTDPLLLAYGAVAANAPSDLQKRMVSFLTDQIPEAEDNETALVHLIHSIGNTKSLPAMYRIIQYVDSNSEIVQIATITAVRFFTGLFTFQDKLISALQSDPSEAIVHAVIDAFSECFVHDKNMLVNDDLHDVLMNVTLTFRNHELESELKTYFEMVDSEKASRLSDNLSDSHQNEAHYRNHRHTTYSPSNTTEATTYSPSNNTEATTYSPCNNTEATTDSPSNNTEATTYSPSNNTEATTYSPSNNTEATTYSPSNKTEATTASPSNNTEATTASPSNNTEATTDSPSNNTEATTYSPSNKTEATTASPSNNTEATTASPSNNTEATTDSPSNTEATTYWSSNNNVYNTIASQSSRQSDVSLYPNYLGYLWNKKFGKTSGYLTAYVDTTVGFFAGVDGHRVENLKVFGKGVVRGHILTSSFDIAKIEAFLQKNEQTYTLFIYFKIGGLVLVNEYATYTRQTTQNHVPDLRIPISKGRYLLIQRRVFGWDFPIFVYVGYITFSVSAYASLDVSTTLSVQGYGNGARATLSYSPQVTFSVEGSASFTFLVSKALFLLIV